VTELNLGWAVAWRAWSGGVLMSAGGLSLIVAAFVALPGRDPSQRAFAVLFGLALLAVGVLILVAARKSALHLSIGEDGFAVAHRTFGGFALSWDELTEVRLRREKRWLGRSRMWHYTLVLRTAGEVAELELWREGSRYRYELGPLGFAGRRLDRALTRYAPVRYRGLTRGT
jgi:hypothetical protein